LNYLHTIRLNYWILCLKQIN